MLQVEEWQTKCKALAKQQEEEKAAAAHKHQEEVDFLEEQGETLMRHAACYTCHALRCSAGLHGYLHSAKIRLSWGMCSLISCSC